MDGIRILIALAAVALAAVVAAAPASPQSLSIGSPLLGDNGAGVNLPDLDGGGSGGGSGGGGGSAATGNLSSGDTSADVDVACIEADVLDISAKVGSCDSGAGAGGGGGGGGGDRGAADAEAGSGELGADAGVGCVDIGLGDLGDGLQIGSCEAIMPPAEDPDDEGSVELPTETGDGVAGAAGGGGSSLGDGADCIAYDELSSAGTPHGIPPWLAGLVGVAMFGFGAFVARRRRPQVEDVAV
jgi:hypothetical protein